MAASGPPTPKVTEKKVEFSKITLEEDDKVSETFVVDRAITRSKWAISRFFGGLSREEAEKIELLAEDITFTEEEEKAVRLKIDLRILPIIVFSYISNQLDRTNIGNAHVIPAFNENFGINSNRRWTLCLSIFYVGYCFLEIPANILQRHIGANHFFSMTLLFWGLASISFIYSSGYGALLILRVLLGIGEAGYYAGMIYYMSFWYQRKELAFRISLCMTGVVPGWIGGLLAFGLVRAHTSVLTGWQFLFLVEAIPTIIMAFVILLWLPSFPFTASFLTQREKAIAVARLKDHKPKSHGGATGLDGLKLVLADLNMWMFAVLYCSCEFSNICVATVSYFLPTIIKGFGYSPINAQGLTVGPYLVGWVIVWAQAWHSDKTRDRGYHIMFSSMIAFIGYVILATQAQKSHRVSYFACYLVVAGAYPLFPLVMGWAANNTSPTSKRGVGTAFIVSLSNCVSIAAPQIYFDPKDHYRKAHGMAGGFIFLTFIMAFLLRTRFDILNKRREKQLAALSAEEKILGDVAAAAQEIPDTDPHFRFLT